ncbi:MAG: alpha/beta hydrolase, partial [Pseudomonadota bacterium]|nr:alpha/beta hydrolase [Pseudomonadota bacterium]
MSSTSKQYATATGIQVEDITIVCADNTPLAASLFSPTTSPTAAVMIGPATGIKRQFYSAFAAYLCEQGFGVITFDNRGIGGSVKSSVKQSDASLVTWGEQDMPAVLETLK